MNRIALHAALPRLDPARAALQTALLRALDGRRAGPLTLAAALAPPASGVWLRFATGRGEVAVAPLLVDGARPLLTGDDGAPDAAATLAALAALEPLVAALEHALEVALDPITIERAPPADTVTLTVEAREAGALRYRLALACRPSDGLAPIPLPPDLSRLSAARAALRFTVSGPILPAGRWVALVPGDLVLLGAGALVGALVVAGGDVCLAARLDRGSGDALVTESVQWRSRVADDPLSPADPAATAVGPEWAAARVPLTLTIDAGALPLAELAALGPGRIVRLGAAGEALAVALCAAGVAVGRGELVGIGDGYGVVVTHRDG